jgi:membrane protein involved in colicin uptake
MPPSKPDDAAAKAAKEARAKEEADKKAAKEARAKYMKKADPATVEDTLGPGELEREWFKDGEWKAGWANVEFVSERASVGEREHGRQGAPARVSMRAPMRCGAVRCDAVRA